MDNNDEIIRRGFNAGYQLEKLKPELARQLLKGFTDKEHPYAVGFKSGAQEYAKERIVQKLQERDQSREQETDRGYDR